MRNKLIHLIHKLQSILSNETLCISLLSIYCAVMLIASRFVYANSIPHLVTMIPKLAVAFFFFLRIVLVNWNNLSIKSKILLLILLIPFLAQAYISHNANLLQLYVLSVGSYGLCFKKILKTIILGLCITGLIIIALSILGIVPNIKYAREGTDIIRHSLGFKYPSHVSGLFFAVTLAFLYLRQNKAHWWEYVIIVFINSLIYLATNTRLVFLLSVLTVAISILLKINLWNILNEKIKSIIKKILPVFAVICAITMLLLTACYTPRQPLFTSLNSMLSGRLRMGYQAIQKYSFSIFGQNIQWTSPITIADNTAPTSVVDIVDSFYVDAPIEFGVLIYLIFLVGIIVITTKSLHRHDQWMVMVMIIISVMSISDGWVTQIIWCPFSLLILSFFLHKKETNIGFQTMEISQLHKIQLLMLQKFADFCNKNQLTYYLCGGTLLGAARHSGFIPWDDDVDILMPRKDYETLQKITKDRQIAKNIKILTPNDKNADFPFIKIYNTNFEAIEPAKRKMQSKEYLWIDLFPIDNLPNDLTTSDKLYRRITFWKKLLAFRTIHSNHWAKDAIKATVRLPLSILSQNFYIKQIDRIAQSYNNQNTNFAGCAVWGYGPCERMKKSAFDKKVEVEFEGKKFYTFSGYDKYLKSLYGEDYMSLPPENQRHMHSILVREETEKSINEK